jgi:4-amino-4-deoxy-L-arabinose transferase-like glycosyltransferase
MTKKISGSLFILILLFYGLIYSILNLDYNTAYHDEALNILMGRQVLSGQPCPPCPLSGGTVIIHPVLASLGDSLGGLYGARTVSLLFGLGLTYIIYLIGKTIYNQNIGLIAASIFIFTGSTLYLSKLATYDIIAAFFLGLSLLLILLSEKTQTIHRKNAWLFAGATALFFAAISKYVVPVYIPAITLYVLWRNKLLRTTLYFLLPLSIFLLLYTYFALYPVKDLIMGSVMGAQEESQVSFSTLSSWTFRWVALPYLLATFGAFHKEKGKTALLFIALSTPIIILHLITGAEQSVNKNVIHAIIFLCPAAAIGIDKMGDLFSRGSTTNIVKLFFIISVLFIVWAYGIYELHWLEKQYPDTSPVVIFFEENGFDGMVVTIDSDYGEATYKYMLDPYYPNAQFVPIAELVRMKNSMNPLYKKPDFVIFDEFYSKKYLHDMALQYMESQYKLIKTFDIYLSWGTKEVKIFARR